MARIIEISNKAYEARDAAQAEMAALKQQADKEQQEFEQEWKELGKMIEQDRKMKDFMKKEREKLSQQEHRGDMTVEQEQSLKKKVLRGNWGIAKDKASIHASMEKVGRAAAPLSPARRGLLGHPPSRLHAVASYVARPSLLHAVGSCVARPPLLHAISPSTVVLTARCNHTRRHSQRSRRRQGSRT